MYETKSKKLVSLTICVVMLILSVVPAFAVSEGDYSIRRGPKYEYKTVYGSDFDKTFSGYPSGQPEEGYSFPVDGGSVYFADNG